MARLSGGQVRLLHVVNEIALVSGFEPYAVTAESIPLLKAAGEELLATGRARALAAGVAADTQLIENFAARLSDVVAEQAQSWGADLIVIGTHGRRGVQRLLLGSDAEMILRTAPVPVLLVRAPEAGAPARHD